MNVKKSILSVAVAFAALQTFSASSDNRCETKLELLKKEGYTIHSEPTRESLREIALLYRHSPFLGKCAYPELDVNSLPIGEYEQISDAEIFNEGITLSARTEYTWKGARYVTSTIHSEDNLSLEHKALESGQLVIEAFDNSLD